MRNKDGLAEANGRRRRRRRVSEDGGFTCASKATPLVISSSAAVASAEKRSSPGKAQTGADQLGSARVKQHHPPTWKRSDVVQQHFSALKRQRDEIRPARQKRAAQAGWSARQRQGTGTHRICRSESIFTRS